MTDWVRRGAAALVALAMLGACSASDAASPVRPASDTQDESPATSLSAIRPIVTSPRPTLPVNVTGTDGVVSSVSDVSRIIVLDGGLAEIVYSLGLGASVVGRDVTTSFPEAAKAELVTSGHTVSAEGLLALRPTVVLADVRTRPATAIEQIRKAGVPVVKLPRAVRLEQIPTRIRAVAQAVGLKTEGESLVHRVEREVRDARVSSPGERPLRVAFLYLRGSAAIYLIGGRGSGADGLLEALGAIDVGAEAGLGDFTPLTPEALVSARPDAYLVMSEGLASVGGIDGLLKVNGVAQTPAGQNRRIVAVDDGLLLGFGPRTPAALHLIAQGLGLRS